METSRFSVTCAVLAVFVSSHAQSLGDPTRTNLGVGAAALGMANTYVAVADDISSLFWNPAGLAMTERGRVLEFSLGGLRPMSYATFNPDALELTPANQMTRIRIGSAGYASVSGRRRRLGSIAFAYQSPYALDTYVDYSGSFQSGSDQVAIRNQYLSVGNLDFWTGGLGFQITPNLSVGGALSVITGTGMEELRYEKRTNGAIADPQADSYHLLSDRTYGGFDARLGMMLRGPELVTMGLRLELPSVVAFEEVGRQSVPASGTPSQYVLEGYLRSYYSAAAGVAVDLPMMTVSAELNGRAPAPRTRIDDPYESWKVGGGVGVELDIIPCLFTGRAGYAWREYDPNPYEVVYNDPVVFDPAVEPESMSGEHTASVGCSYRFGERVSVDLAYAHRLWRTTAGGALNELHQSQRALGALTFKL